MPARSSAWTLALIFAALIVYASLYPFEGWRVQGVGLLDFLVAAWAVNASWGPAFTKTLWLIK